MKQPASRYLFVFTRDVVTAPSARYLLRHAATLGREGHQLTFWLIDGAATLAGAERARAIPTARLCMLRNGSLPIEQATGWAIEALSEADLSALMLVPGMQTYWC